MHEKVEWEDMQDTHRKVQKPNNFESFIDAEWAERRPGAGFTDSVREFHYED